jgi:hypothetical protein
VPTDINITYFNYNKPDYFIFIYLEPCKRDFKEIEGEKLYDPEEENK